MGMARVNGGQSSSHFGYRFHMITAAAGMKASPISYLTRAGSASHRQRNLFLIWLQSRLHYSQGEEPPFTITSTDSVEWCTVPSSLELNRRLSLNLLPTKTLIAMMNASSATVHTKFQALVIVFPFQKQVLSLYAELG